MFERRYSMSSEAHARLFALQLGYVVPLAAVTQDRDEVTVVGTAEDLGKSEAEAADYEDPKVEDYAYYGDGEEGSSYPGEFLG